MSKRSPRVVAIIPARAGSRRIPGKNLVPFGGRPLLVHTIDAALGAFFVDATFVSTESPDIARVARAAGAEVIRRPAHLASDTAATEPVLLHALGALRRRRIDPEVIVLLQATSPLRTAAPVDMAVAKILETGCDSVVSVTPNDRIFWEGAVEDGRFVPRRAIADRPRTQEIPTRYCEDGAIYAMRTTLLETTGLRMGGDLRAVILAPHESVDIDTPADLELAEHYLAMRRFDPDARPRALALAM